MIHPRLRCSQLQLRRRRNRNRHPMRRWPLLSGAPVIGRGPVPSPHFCCSRPGELKLHSSLAGEAAWA